MVKTILITRVVLGVIGAVGAAWAKRGGYCSAENRVRYITERVDMKLELSDDQRDRLEAFVDTLRELRDKRRDHSDGIKDNGTYLTTSQREWLIQCHSYFRIKEDVTDLLTAPTRDRDRAVAMMVKRYQSIAGSMRALVDAFAEFSDSLAPEQRTRLAELIADAFATDRLQLDFDPEGTWLSLDPTRILLVRNLLKNALRYSPTDRLELVLASNAETLCGSGELLDRIKID